MRNELIPLFHNIGLLRAVVLYDINGKRIITQLHQNKYSSWAYINNFLRDGHVLLYPDGTTNHVRIIKWDEYHGDN